MQHILNMNITYIAVFCSTLCIFLIFKSIPIESCIDLGDKFRCISVEACSAGSLVVSSREVCGPLSEGHCCPVINIKSPPSCGILKARIVYWQGIKAQETNNTSEVQSFGKGKRHIRSILDGYLTTHLERLKIPTNTTDSHIYRKNKTLKEVTNAGENIPEFTTDPSKVCTRFKIDSELKLDNVTTETTDYEISQKNKTFEEVTNARQIIGESTADLTTLSNQFKIYSKLKLHNESQDDINNGTEFNVSDSTTYSNTPVENAHNSSLKDEQVQTVENQYAKPSFSKNKQDVPPTEYLETAEEYDKFEETPTKQDSVLNKNNSEGASDSKTIFNVLSSPIPMAIKGNSNNNLKATSDRENKDDRRSTAENSSDISLFSHSTVEKNSPISTKKDSNDGVPRQSPGDKINSELSFLQRATSPTFDEINNSEVNKSQNKAIKSLVPVDMRKAATVRLKNATGSDSNVEELIPEEYSSTVNPQKGPSSENFSFPENDDEDEGMEGMLQTIGGNLEYEDWPWMVSIYRYPGMFFLCGGSLIDDRHIVSAAHCFYGHLANATYIVSIGKVLRISNASEGYEIKEAIIHEGFKPSCYCNDIAVLRLAQPLTANYTPVCLVDFDTAVVGQYTTILGWGDTAYKKQDSSTKRLQKVSDLPIISSKECRMIISRILKKELPEEFEKYTICAGLPDGSKDACLGDSGGPLMHETFEGSWALLGVVSFGYKCGEPGIPGTYSRVSYYMPWILKTIGS